MNKSLILKNIGAFALIAIFMVVPMVAFGQWTGTSGGDANAKGSGVPGGTIYAIIKVTMNWLLAILGFIAIIGFVIAGILYLTAAGRDDQIKQAKTAMTYSILGVIVALVGYVIVGAVDSWLGAKGNTEI